MNSDNTTITASEFPIALLSLGLPLMIAAFNLSGTVAPFNLADILVTGLAVFGLLAEPFKNKRKQITPVWFNIGIPSLLIVWISYSFFTKLTHPLTETIPFLMEARPLLYLIVAALWVSIFTPPQPRQIAFWSGWLALFICAEFLYHQFGENISIQPHFLGNYTLTGPILLMGLCATLHNTSENRFTRILILAGIFCSLERDISFAAVTVMLLFGPKGILKKLILVLLLLVFNYISLIPQDMSLLSRTDLPNYWIWFSSLGLLANNPSLLLTGFPLSVPLPLNIPASLWNIWNEQHFVWSGLGIYLFHLTPFWLHILTTWGLGGICAIAATATILIRRYPSDMLASLISIVIITGFFSPIIYAPATGVVFFMVIISATQPEIQSFKFE
ncbi:hypothetical protein [Maridesulfovibrio zosterae]|uniref:hypothetical protein n=1 Tax=Maridesulfovibrio zosterae TaxID=82171 RepID=UPI00048487E9|nr:hypothetical protein [Maridesulfovibrio zosterae]